MLKYGDFGINAWLMPKNMTWNHFYINGNKGKVSTCK